MTAAVLTPVATPSFTGTAIRFARERKQLSARALSLRAGLSPAYVFKAETGAIEPSFRSFCRLALALDMTVQEVWVCVVNEAQA